MANAATPAPSLDQMLQESRRKREAQDLAQQIFGKKNRAQTPQAPRSKPAPGASLASRLGVVKRTASLPRSNPAPLARHHRPAPPATRPPLSDSHRTRSAYNPPPSSDPASDDKSHGRSAHDAPPASNGSGNISFRGAANTGPHVVIARNFAPGTSAEDIASVMTDVGGQVTECILIAEAPTVIAEMTFADRAGAESVINTFNGKKADGRTLNVYLKPGSGTKPNAYAGDVLPAAEEAMEIDENARAREAEDRLREERRGRNDRVFPTGPRSDRPYEDEYYNRGPRRADPAYQDGRYGFQRGYGNGGGRYRNDGDRMYLDRVGGGRGQSWRP